MVWSGRLKLTRPDYLNVCKHIYIYIYVCVCVCVCVGVGGCGWGGSPERSLRTKYRNSRHIRCVNNLNAQ